MTNQEKLKTELNICVIHEERLNMALKHIHSLIPITPAKLNQAKEDELAFLDMIATRFGKLQDALGKKIFPLILRITGDYDERETFIDKLHRLEKLGVIESTLEWQKLRDVRNILTHEYEDDINKLCETTNVFIEKCSVLIAVWKKVQSYVLQHKFIV